MPGGGTKGAVSDRFSRQVRQTLGLPDAAGQPPRPAFLTSSVRPLEGYEKSTASAPVIPIPVSTTGLGYAAQAKALPFSSPKVFMGARIGLRFFASEDVLAFTL